jgi:hypothetical protein
MSGSGFSGWKDEQDERFTLKIMELSPHDFWDMKYYHERYCCLQQGLSPTPILLIL